MSSPYSQLSLSGQSLLACKYRLHPPQPHKSYAILGASSVSTWKRQAQALDVYADIVSSDLRPRLRKCVDAVMTTLGTHQ